MSKAAELAKAGEVMQTGQLGGRRNFIYNGAMQIAQRSASVTGITGAGYHTLDRWNSNISSFGTWTQTQSTDVPAGEGFTTSLKMDVTTAEGSPAAADTAQVRQLFEGQDLQRLKYGTSNAENITLSFWVKATKTGVNVVTLYQDDAEKQISGTYTIGTTNTWEYKTITFVGNTADVMTNDATRGFICVWHLGSGSNRTEGTLRTVWTAYTDADEAVGQVNHGDSTSNDWLLTGVQMEIGSQATNFEHRSFGEELLLCQRYCTVHNMSGDADEYVIPYSQGQVDSTNRAEIHILYPEKRAAPTITVTNPTNFKVMTGANTAITASGFSGALVGTGIHGANLFWGVSSGVAVNDHTGNIKNIYLFQNTGAIKIDAEL